MNFTTIKDKIVAYETEISELQTRYRAFLKDKLVELLGEYFKEDEETAAIVWSQYTPYFNDDDDECIFNVSEPAFYSKAYVEEHGTEDLYTLSGDLEAGIDLIWDSSVPADAHGCRQRQATQNEELRGELAAILQGIGMQDILQLTFGDHTKVTVTATGIKTEKYDHD